jgi:UDP-N-acetylglucosamine pyrophosphorylase
MRAEKLSEAAIAAFKRSYTELLSGSSGMIAESNISAVQSLPDLDADIRGHHSVDPALLKQTLVLKLNGGLGTSMGLDKAKPLLKVKETDSFLDLTAKQVIAMRKHFNSDVAFTLLHSFNTSKDTLSYLQRYPSIISDPNLELMQNKVRIQSMLSSNMIVYI